MLVRELSRGIMTRINAAACVTPVNLIGLVLLATPRQSMGEADLARQLELYASLLRQAPYSPKVWVTNMDGMAMIRYGTCGGLSEQALRQDRSCCGRIGIRGAQPRCLRVQLLADDAQGGREAVLLIRRMLVRP